MNLWYPGAIHDPQQDSGDYVCKTPRGVLHSTESSGYPSYKPGTHPHFTAYMDGKTPRVRQHIPLDKAARALMHPSGTIDTNREDAIQIEIATYAAHVAETPAALLTEVRTLMRWIEQQTGIKATAPKFKAYPASYGINNGVRFTAKQWASFNGWCGHEHVPGNDHGDPGLIDITFLLAPAPPLPATKQPSVIWKAARAVARKVVGAKFYTVVRGDTLASVAKRYRWTVAQLEAMNPGIQSKPLMAGKRVKVRTGTN